MSSYEHALININSNNDNKWKHELTSRESEGKSVLLAFDFLRSVQPLDFSISKVSFHPETVERIEDMSNGLN
jgi:hypothetical protein